MDNNQKQIIDGLLEDYLLNMQRVLLLTNQEDHQNLRNIHSAFIAAKVFSMQFTSYLLGESELGDDLKKLIGFLINASLETLADAKESFMKAGGPIPMELYDQQDKIKELSAEFPYEKSSIIV